MIFLFRFRTFKFLWSIPTTMTTTAYIVIFAIILLIWLWLLVITLLLFLHIVPVFIQSFRPLLYLFLSVLILSPHTAMQALQFLMHGGEFPAHSHVYLIYYLTLAEDSLREQAHLFVKEFGLGHPLYYYWLLDVVWEVVNNGFLFLWRVVVIWGFIKLIRCWCIIDLLLILLVFILSKPLPKRKLIR